MTASHLTRSFSESCNFPLMGFCNLHLLYMRFSRGPKYLLLPLRLMSALPPIADIGTQPRDVRFVPKADMVRCGERHRYSITSSAATIKLCGTRRPSALAVFRLIAS